MTSYLYILGICSILVACLSMMCYHEVCQLETKDATNQWRWNTTQIYYHPHSSVFLKSGIGFGIGGVLMIIEVFLDKNKQNKESP